MGFVRKFNGDIEVFLDEEETIAYAKGGKSQTAIKTAVEQSLRLKLVTSEVLVLDDEGVFLYDIPIPEKV